MRRTPGALPRTPPGRASLPGPATCDHCLAVFTSSAPQFVEQRRQPFPGRPASPAVLCAKAHREKGRGFRENELAHFSENPCPFLLPGNPLADLSSIRRKQVCLICLVPSPSGSRDEIPGAGSGGAEPPAPGATALPGRRPWPAVRGSAPACACAGIWA